MDFINNLKQTFARRSYTDAEVDRLVRFAKSRQGLKLTAQLMQQTDSLTKKDIATWRQAWQAAISIDNPNRARLYDIYTDCLVDLHLTGCIGQRKGKTLQKDFRLVGKDGKENPEGTKLLQKEWFNNFCDLVLDSRFWGHSLIQLGDIVSDENGMRFEGMELVPRKHVCPEYGVITPNLPRTGAREYRIARAISPVVYRSGYAQRLGATTKMRAVLHKQEKHARVLGHVRRDIRRAHARGAYQYNR